MKFCEWISWLWIGSLLTSTVHNPQVLTWWSVNAHSRNSHSTSVWGPGPLYRTIASRCSVDALESLSHFVLSDLRAWFEISLRSWGSFAQSNCLLKGLVRVLWAVSVPCWSSHTDAWRSVWGIDEIETSVLRTYQAEWAYDSEEGRKGNMKREFERSLRERLAI
jgi:hypothetical protein